MGLKLIKASAKKEVRIRRGVRQACPLSSYLYNIFIEEAVTVMKDKIKGIKINGKHIHIIRFAGNI